MPCITDITNDDMSRHFEVLLCKACKFLTVEQIESLKNRGSGIFDGIEWYAQHLWLDCTHNIQRDVLHYLDDNDLEEERKLALKELNRIGFDVIEDHIGSALIKIIEKA